MEVAQRWALDCSGCPLVDTLVFIVGQCTTAGINVWRFKDYQNGKMFVEITEIMDFQRAGHDGHASNAVSAGRSAAAEGVARSSTERSTRLRAARVIFKPGPS